MPEILTGNILTTPDVLIIGGGVAGVAAAAGAAQCGASVTLLEKNAFAGGKATAAYVGTVCGLFYRSEQPVAQFVQQGFVKEFAVELTTRSKIQPIQYKNGLHFLPYNYFDFMLLCDDWLKKSTSTLCYHSCVHHAVADGDRIVSLYAMISNRTVTFKPKAIIDVSGDDLTAGILQLNSIKSDYYQAAAHVFQFSGIRETDMSVLSLALIRSVQKGISSNQLPSFFERVSLVPGSLRNGNVLLKLPLPFQISDDSFNKSELETFSRNAINELALFLKQNSEAFISGTITFVAPEAGIRTGARHQGKDLLTGEDVLQCRKRMDTIARGAWPVEYWEPGKPVKMEYFNMDDYYDIPAGAIQSNALANLFFGGRNISADDTAIASARVIGTCLATGYASGVLAAACARNQSQVEAIESVQQSMSVSSLSL